MSYRFTDWDYMYHTRPEELRQRILTAVVEHKADMRAVRTELDTSQFRFYWYVRKLGLKETIANIRAAMKARGDYVRRRYVDAPAKPKAKSVFTKEHGRTVTAEIPVLGPEEVSRGS